MQIDTQLIERLSKLGGIALNEKEQEVAKANLSEIVNFVENINSLDLDGIPASFNVLDSTLQMREDVAVDKSTIAKSILEHAPKAEDNFFIVPKIIE
ncbi:MAG: Asp-tRNA(Asn)/Glu-tRNA(Gln) amidotransferase subunit GatC [Helicobacter sp.]|nr:Asp-tRNA(Asn)/Glu-tRNA(Gln) amidotransferase subunit GatC [Helicobacteraceae bacterium]MDY3113366.1 Asp-tRNA(Asn)/Glu-tRNA(Gln) amidotransferase subunit GatC [Helicobacter sp.]